MRRGAKTALACIAAVGVMAGVLMAGCGGSDSEDAGGASSLRLRLDWVPYASSHAFFYYGREKGLYENQGIDLNIEPGNGSATVLKSVATGTDPLGLVDASTYLTGSAEGIDSAKAIFALTRSNPQGFIFKADRPIGSAKELEGKKLVTTQGDFAAAVLPAVLAKHGLSKDDIELQTVGSPAAKETAVLQGRADTLMGYVNEQALRLEETQGVDIGTLPLRDLGIEIMNYVVVANTDWLAKHEQEAAAFVKATQAAIEATVSKPRAAAEAFVAADPTFDQKLALKEVKSSLDYLASENTEDAPFGWMAEEDWQATADLLKGGGTKLGDVADLYTNDFFEDER